MHPAPSVILFTTFSGLGFGLLAWLGIDPTPPTGWVAFAFFFIGFALSVGGLMASTFHLGHPERAWRAFSQWRSSWLSREGVCAVVALIVMGLYAAALIFLGQHFPVLGWIGAALSVATVYTTSMIYAQLKTVPRWNHWSTSALFLTHTAAGGALLAGKTTIAVPLIALAGAALVYHWITGDQREATSPTTLETATGLGAMGKVKAFEAPHTGTNYLLKEMAFAVGRKHSQRLKFIGLTLGYILPVVLLLIPFSHLAAAVAVLSHVIGIVAARWLFFAAAKHKQATYYGLGLN